MCLFYVAWKAFLLLVHMNLDIHLRQLEPDGQAWSLDEPLTVQRAREGPAVVAPGRLLVDRLSAWHSGPCT